MLSVRVNAREADAALASIVAGVKKFPSGRNKNPLIAVMYWYRKQLDKWWKTRPTVAQSGTWMGDRWPGFDDAYVAYERLGKDGTGSELVPIWGGVKRRRKGRVTRARDGIATQRKGKTLTPEESAAGYGAVKLGQTFGGRNVLGKLKSDGSRYKKSDKQLGRAKDGLLRDWATGGLVVKDNNKTVINTTSKPYAAAVAADRPFHWNARIARVVINDPRNGLTAMLKKYVVELFKAGKLKARHGGS